MKPADLWENGGEADVDFLRRRKSALAAEVVGDAEMIPKGWGAWLCH